MSEIYVKENESLDNALKRFKRSCAKSGVLADLRKKEYYQSPSVKRRERKGKGRSAQVAPGARETRRVRLPRGIAKARLRREAPPGTPP